MTEYNLQVQNQWLKLIAAGYKTVEGRLRKDKFNDLKVGDVIVFNKIFKKKVTSIRYYKTFYAYLLAEGLSRTLPGVESIREAIDVYRALYSIEDEIKYGVIAITLTSE